MAGEEQEENHRHPLEHGDDRRYVEVQICPHGDLLDLGAIGQRLDLVQPETWTAVAARAPGRSTAR
ncbi:hypothetical protein [Ensifer canadensis]